MNKAEILQEISDLCKAGNYSIACAESVSSGYIQFLLSQLPDALMIFNGGITAYNIGQKVKHLHIDFTIAQPQNGVSRAIAKEMALQATVLFNSQIGLGITGFASLEPALQVTERHAYVAIVKQGKLCKTEKIKSLYKKSSRVQEDFAVQSLQLLLKCLKT